MSTRIYWCETSVSGVSVEVDGISDKVKRVHNLSFSWMLKRPWAKVSKWKHFTKIEEVDPESRQDDSPQGQDVLHLS